MQMKTWTLEQPRTMELVKLFPSHFFSLFPGFVAKKATTTVIVFAKTEEMAVEKMMLKTICCRRQVGLVGLPMKRKGVKKESRSEIRRMKERSWLFALTIGVFKNLMKITKTKPVISDKKRAMVSRTIPKASL